MYTFMSYMHKTRQFFSIFIITNSNSICSTCIKAYFCIIIFIFNPLSSANLQTGQKAKISPREELEIIVTTAYLENAL